MLDFGISKILGAHDHDITHTDTLLGSPNYMSPEQMQSTRDVDARSDLWSLGVILYQLLTRELPFRGRGITEIVAAVLQGGFRLPSAIRPELAGFDSIVLRCLERDPVRRYADVGELARALGPFLPASAPLVDSISRLVASPSRSAVGLPVAVLSESQRLVFTPRPSPGGTPGAAVSSPPPSSGSASGASNAWGGTSGGASPRRSRALFVGTAIAAMLIGGLVALAYRAHGDDLSSRRDRSRRAPPSLRGDRRADERARGRGDDRERRERRRGRGRERSHTDGVIDCAPRSAAHATRARPVRYGPQVTRAGSKVTAVILGIALTAGAAPARADAGADAEKAAQALFLEAMKLLAAKQYSEACDKLARSQELDPGMGTQFRLAECYEKLNRPASAYAAYVAVAEAAKTAGKRDREIVARKRASSLESKVAWLTILIPPVVAALPDVEVTRDGLVVPDRLWGVPVPVEPGDHVVKVTARKKKPWSNTLFTEAAAKFTVSVATPDDATPPPPRPPPPPKSIAPTIAFAIVGGAGLVVGGVFVGLRAAKSSTAHSLSSTISKAQGNCVDGGMARFAASCHALASATSAGDAFGTASVVGWVVGGAGLVALTTYLLWPAPAAPVMGLRLAPSIGVREGALVASGSF